MSIKSVETPATESFEKVYQDEFVRVYSVLMSPHISSDLEPGQKLLVPSKRKSSNTSLRLGSPKRAARSGASDTEDSTPPKTSLNWNHPSFNPSSLTGEEASEWRSIIIRDMFPGEEQTPATNLDKEPPSGRSKPWVPRARKSQQRLPKFEGPRSTSAAYLVLGPEIRGKFDPAAADALGVAKRDRGKLTRGESVTVTADGVQTIVTPSMCVGKSETPTVCRIGLIDAD
jgi:ribonuclease Z